MRIFLIGYMGCGKTTFGKKLARKLEYSFLDMDKTIEQEEGQSITSIFESKGEAYFRELEFSVLQKCSLMNNAVIATGGGTPCSTEAIRLINNSGISVYLQMDAQSLNHRLGQSNQERPLLAGKETKQLAEFIQQQLLTRAPYYLQANIIVDTLRLSANMEGLISTLQDYSR